MKKTLFILGLLLSVAFLYAQNQLSGNFVTAIDQNATANQSAKNGSMTLWDNTNINVQVIPAGGTSTYWGGNDNWAWIADDFDADGPWIIEKIYSKAYYPDDEHVTTNKMAIVFYLDDGGKPGEEIYRNVNITVADVEDSEIILPTPFTLPGPGKYWITIASVYPDKVVAVNGDVRDYRTYIFRGAAKKGCNYHYYDKMGLFTAYPQATWADAGPIVNLFSSYFKIEGDPNIPIICNPVTNLNVVYAGECSKAELTWTAPAKDAAKYLIFRDGEQIATVETESYTDLTFEPTLEHTWSVKVECNGYTPMVNFTKTFCKPPDCPQRPKHLEIDYNNDTDCEAILQWHAPTEVLFDNTTFPTPSTGQISYYFSLETFPHAQTMADDFIVPAGETWYLSEVHYGGFHNDYTAPNYMGIEIFEDNGGFPGEMIYYNHKLITGTGIFSIPTYVLLPEPVVISTAGKYWVSIFGVYENIMEDDFQYYIYVFDTNIGSPKAFWIEANGEWEANTGSMYFRLQGQKTSTPILYNIYRDGVLIDEGVSGTTYTDTSHDPTKQHTWSVKTVCPDGSGESAPVYLTVIKCKEGGHGGGVNDIERLFTIFPNPTSGSITIKATSDFSMVEVINFLGQTVISQPNANATVSLDVSHLNSGIYFVRIATDQGIAVQKFVKQ